MYQKHKVGKIGEELAEKYIINKGYQIIEKNFSCKQGEIDIIAQDKDEIVIIEVKTRTQTKYGTPSESVNNQKQNHILRVAEYYIHFKNLQNRYIRIDVIEVYFYKLGKCKINHIKQAF